MNNGCIALTGFEPGARKGHKLLRFAHLKKFRCQQLETENAMCVYSSSEQTIGSARLFVTFFN